MGEQVLQAERAGADRIPGDVMDGHFVPNRSIGAPGAHSVRRVTRLPLKIHLMVSDPDSFLDESVEAVRDGARESPAGDAPHAAPTLQPAGVGSSRQGRGRSGGFS